MWFLGLWTTPAGRGAPGGVWGQRSPRGRGRGPRRLGPCRGQTRAWRQARWGPEAGSRGAALLLLGWRLGRPGVRGAWGVWHVGPRPCRVAVPSRSDRRPGHDLMHVRVPRIVRPFHHLLPVSVISVAGLPGVRGAAIALPGVPAAAATALGLHPARRDGDSSGTVSPPSFGWSPGRERGALVRHRW